MDDNNNPGQAAGCFLALLVFFFTLALFLAWFSLNIPFMDSVDEWKRLWHAKFPTWKDWHDASEPVRLTGWRLGAVMDFLDAIAGLMVLGGILLIVCRKRSAGTTRAVAIGTWLLIVSPALLMVVGSVVGIVEHWSRINDRPDGKNPEMALFLKLGMHAVAWSGALFLATPLAWVRWEWKRALFVFVFCLLTAQVLGLWGVKTVLHVPFLALT